MNGHLSEFINRILVNNHTKWWKNLRSETNKNKGRCLQSTLEEELFDIPEYRKADRRLFFFSSHKASSIDGRYKDVGIEEKYNPLDLKEHLIDGAIHRGVVWVFGNPQNVPSPIEAITLYVVQDNSRAISINDVDLYFPIIYSLFKFGIHLVFINGKTGDYWTFGNDHNKNPLPKWLSEKESPLIWDKKIEVVNDNNLEALKIITDEKELNKKTQITKTLPGFGKRGEYKEIEINSSSKATIIDYGNEWRLIELGLLLRSYGYDAVKVIYNKQKHKNSPDRLKDKIAAGMGVEKRVAHEMFSRFSVSIDWRTEI